MMAAMIEKGLRFADCCFTCKYAGEYQPWILEYIPCYHNRHDLPAWVHVYNICDQHKKLEKRNKPK